jgi:hypothetical protein
LEPVTERMGAAITAYVWSYYFLPDCWILPWMGIQTGAEMCGELRSWLFGSNLLCLECFALASYLWTLGNFCVTMLPLRLQLSACWRTQIAACSPALEAHAGTQRGGQLCVPASNTQVERRFQDGHQREEAESVFPKVKSCRDAGDTPCRKNHQEEVKLRHNPSLPAHS